VTARCDPYHEAIPPIPPEIVAEAAHLYVEVFETITGRRFDFPDPAMPILDRIRANLTPYFRAETG
jgi:phosphoribosylaminoimidazole-succinocarboxamide synthase